MGGLERVYQLLILSLLRPMLTVKVLYENLQRAFGMGQDGHTVR